MIYLDTSFVIAVLAEEPHSVLVRAFLDGYEATDLAASAWVGTEVASALAMKRRRGDVDRDEHDRLALEWRRTRGLVIDVAVTNADFTAAASLVDAGPRGLRAGDALHLAIAQRRGLSLATLDRHLADAADAAGVAVALRPPG